MHILDISVIKLQTEPSQSIISCFYPTIC